jgi:putative sugar O-methyltransferase
VKQHDGMVDDQALLDQMVDDWQASTGYEELRGEIRSIYTDFVEDLTTLGLAGCIDQRVRGVTAINGCDAHPTSAPHAKVDFSSSFTPEVKSAVQTTLELVKADREAAVLPYDLSLKDLDDAAFRLCEITGELAGVRPLKDFKMSKVHRPEYTFVKNGNEYSYPVLYSYLHYVNCAQHVDFEEVENVVEIGPGAGRQVELIRRFHPNINFYLFDVAPTLYFCERFLSAAFPGAVVPYQDLRERAEISIDGTGKIACLGHWQIDGLRPIGRTLSFNTAVFCLMSPSHAERYFDHLMAYADSFYLMEPRRADCSEIYGLPESTCLEDLERFLDGGFDLLNCDRAVMPLGLKKGFGDFHSMVWRRRGQDHGV